MSYNNEIEMPAAEVQKYIITYICSRLDKHFHPVVAAYVEEEFHKDITVVGEDEATCRREINRKLFNYINVITSYLSTSFNKAREQLDDTWEESFKEEQLIYKYNDNLS